ncbi:hypothetical protein F4801DRAFT_567433 [Xylaria longipes]|nr:hypothetical protein F4801DRAFT_567433 [Xylaria longipes]
MRIQTTQTQDPGTGDNRPGKAKNETKNQESLPETPVAAPESPEAGKPPQYRRENPLENTRWLGPRPVVGSWAHQGGEWPWRIEQVMYRDIWDNARGTSVLEVKDIFAFYSNTVPQHYESFPPLEEGREADFCGLDVEEGDDMMEWLGE